MEKVTRAFVEKQLENLNKTAGMPLKPYETVNGEATPCAGCYHLESGYGGYQFIRMSSTKGSTGTSSILSAGFQSLRKVSKEIHAYHTGYRAAKWQAEEEMARSPLLSA